MDRLCVFHSHKGQGNPCIMSPAYYMDADYDKVAVRVYAEETPIRDASFDVYTDGVSIFNDRGFLKVNSTTGVLSTVGAGTDLSLPSGENSDDAVADFSDTSIESGTWLTCVLLDAGGGANFTVQVELRQTSDDDEKDSE